MTVAFRAAGVLQNSNPSVPTSAEVGDLLLLAAQNPVSGPGSDWSLLSAGSGALSVWYKFAAGSDAGTSVSCSAQFSFINAYSGVPNIPQAIASAMADSTITTPPLALPPEGLLVSVGAFPGSGYGSPPTGWTAEGSTGEGEITLVSAHIASSPSSWTWNSAPGTYATISLALWTAPNAPAGLTPNGTTVDNTIAQRLAWSYTNPNTGDIQSQFDLQWRHQGSSDTWNTVSQTTPNSYWDAPGGTFPAEGIEWQVRTYDQGGLVSPWSTLTTFTAAAPTGTPTITAPTSGGTIGLTPSTVSWSAPAQQAYQVRTVADDGTGNPNTAVVYTDTGQVTDSVTRSIQVAYATNNIVVHTQVRVEQNSLWSAWADVSDTVSYTPPTTPTLTATPNVAAGVITITPTIPPAGTGQPTTTSIDLWCRTAASSLTVDPQRPTTVGARIGTGLNPSIAIVDWAPASGVIYEYQIVANGSNTTTATSAWTA